MISIIKLSNGETIMANVSYADDNKLTVSEPLKLEYIQHFGGPAMITTFWVPFEKDKISVDINIQHVIMYSKVPKGMISFYNKSLASVRESIEPEISDEVKERVKQAMKKYMTSNTTTTVH